MRFSLWDFGDRIGSYLPRQINTDGGRLSPPMTVLVVGAISLALWLGIAVLVVRFI